MLTVPSSAIKQLAGGVGAMFGSGTLVWRQSLSSKNAVLSNGSFTSLSSEQQAFQATIRGDIRKLRRALAERERSNQKGAEAFEESDDDGLPLYWHQEGLIHVAIAARQQQVVEVLVDEFGANVNLASENGVTPLMKACENHLERIVRLLICRGAKLDLQDDFGSTALSRGVKSYWGPCGAILSEAGANSNLVDRYGHTARQDALHCGNVESALALSGPSAILVPGFESPAVQSVDGFLIVVRDMALYCLDVSSDVLVALTILQDDERQDKWVGILILCFVVLPGVLSFFLPDQSGLERLLSLLQLRFLYETFVSLSQERFTIRYQTIQLLQTIAEDIPNLLLQTFVVFRAVYVNRTESAKNVFDTVFIVSLLISLISNSQTAYSTYLGRFMRSKDSSIRNLLFWLTGSFYALTNIYMRFVMMISLALIASNSSGVEGNIVRVVASALPLLMWVRSYHIASVHQLEVLQTDIFASVGFDGAMAQSKPAFLAVAVFSFVDFVLFLIIPSLLGVLGVPLFALQGGGLDELPLLTLHVIIFAVQIMTSVIVFQNATSLAWGQKNRQDVEHGARDLVAVYGGMENQLKTKGLSAALSSDTDEVIRELGQGCVQLKSKEPVQLADLKLFQCAGFLGSIPAALGAVVETLIGALSLTTVYGPQVCRSLQSKWNAGVTALESTSSNRKHQKRPESTGFRLSHVPQFALVCLFILIAIAAGLCFSRAELISGQQCPEVLLSNPEIFIGTMAFVYFVSLIEAYRCSEGQYLRRMIPVERGFDYLCRYQGAIPKIKWRITCFHLMHETKWHGKFVAKTLGEGTKLPLKAIAITHTEETEFAIDESWSQSVDLPSIDAACRLKVQTGYVFADQETRQLYENEKQAFVDKFKDRDAMYSIEETFCVNSSFASVDEQELVIKRRMFLYNEFRVSRFLRFTYYALAATLFSSLPYRILSPRTQASSVNALSVIRRAPSQN